MEDLIYISSADFDTISVTPEQIAYIMGRHEVIKELRTKGDQEFIQLINSISQKEKEFLEHGHTKAAAAAATLNQTLSVNLLKYYSLESNQKSYSDFKKSCTTALNIARPTLEKHRGWKDFFAQLALALVSLGLANCTLAMISKYKTGQYSFRLFNTDSVQHMIKIETIVQEWAP